MIRELGYCSGIENYSRYLDGRLRNKTVLFVRLFSKDFLLVVDESHVTLSQVSAMYGDRSRKENLVEYGFRLPAAMDNRPLNLMNLKPCKIKLCVSNSCGLRIKKNRGVVVEQVIRPTGLLDPWKSDQV
jgi:excinuclease ABC subunit B